MTRDALLKELTDAREILDDEDATFARVYVPEQATRAAMRAGIRALDKAISYITTTQEAQS